MDFHAIRKEYENQGIDEASLSEDPLEVFKDWYELAVDKAPGKWLEPNAMSLATSDGAGNVSNRYVLMKQIQDDGIQFFTNYDSQKGKQIAANANCAVAFHWPRPRFNPRRSSLESFWTGNVRNLVNNWTASRFRCLTIGEGI